jgi:hypothetical protein
MVRASRPFGWRARLQKGTTMKRIVFAAALAASAAFAQDKAPAAAPAAPADKAAAMSAMPKPPEEMSALKWFVGSWNCKGVRHAGQMGPEMKIADKIDFKIELAGFWMQVKGTAVGGPMKGKELFEGFAGWDGTQYARFDFSPGGMQKFTTKGWDGDKIVFDGDGMMGGQKMSLKHTVTKKGDNAWESRFESDGKPMIEETCTRGGAATAAK